MSEAPMRRFFSQLLRGGDCWPYIGVVYCTQNEYIHKSIQFSSVHYCELRLFTFFFLKIMTREGKTGCRLYEDEEEEDAATAICTVMMVIVDSQQQQQKQQQSSQNRCSCLSSSQLLDICELQQTGLEPPLHLHHA
jgi:hypothetical protein